MSRHIRQLKEGTKVKTVAFLCRCGIVHDYKKSSPNRSQNFKCKSCGQKMTIWFRITQATIEVQDKNDEISEAIKNFHKLQTQIYKWPIFKIRIGTGDYCVDSYSPKNKGVKISSQPQLGVFLQTKYSQKDSKFIMDFIKEKTEYFNSIKE